ncbi:enoyl-CoA hydratase/isomerase family protein [Devosia sediminis]|uniref:Enoyl-CoA hydratase/isomerase family protein n=1 Tax=Devosia sediminis TaxID=2798801 RepID=A0A934IZB7_9HYPH|nr:enoyl-CoA hydratase/isomerase family protein [Devosia sediminis]MBJ3784970.1 enoyl-CoA hydratase/isomerase family protein [Devosia sediminis]
MSTTAHVGIEALGRVRLLTIMRPERRNALGTQTMVELDRAIQSAADDGFGAVVLTGAEPAFCAGSDLKELAGMSPAEMRDHERRTGDIAAGFSAVNVPVIAAVEGYALGGGMILAASCDLVVTADDVRWNMPEVRNGWLPPWGLGALVGRVGPQRALGLTLGASPCDGTQAHHIGLADHVCAPGAALREALALAETIAALPAHAVQSTKRFYQRFRQHVAMDADSAAQFETDASHPAAQALLSRFAKKP